MKAKMEFTFLCTKRSEGIYISNLLAVIQLHSISSPSSPTLGQEGLGTDPSQASTSSRSLCALALVAGEPPHAVGFVEGLLVRSLCSCPDTALPKCPPKSVTLLEIFFLRKRALTLGQSTHFSQSTRFGSEHPLLVRVPTFGQSTPFWGRAPPFWSGHPLLGWSTPCGQGNPCSQSTHFGVRAPIFGSEPPVLVRTLIFGSESPVLVRSPRFGAEQQGAGRARSR